MANPTSSDLHASLVELNEFRSTYLTGDEKGQAQVFCDRLFKAFGHEGVHEAGATLEHRLKKNDSKGTAFADLMWKPRCLIEMKKAGTDLSKHYRQAFDYWVAAVPDRPRYVVLCNFDEFWIYDFDNQLDEPVDRVLLADLPARHDAMAFLLPAALEPVFGNDLVAVTREAAAEVAMVFGAMHARGVERGAAQRFVLQAVMAMFSEDIGLLPEKFFTRALEDSKTGTDAYDLVFNLFREMNAPGVTPGGRYAGTPYFNGGLFAEVTAEELTTHELDLLRDAAKTDWSLVRPEIFGTLFEGSMDEGERHAAGAHFTSQADIAKVVIPTIVTPWRERIDAAKNIPELEQLLLDMYSFRVLDPACGSGNFLYVAYREMRRLERDAVARIAEKRTSAKADQAAFAYVTPDHFYGIDLKPFAVEIAKVTMMLAKKLSADELGDDQQVLPLDNLDDSIRAADALFTTWPKADAIIGNPPYLGRRKIVEELGASYSRRLAAAHPNVGGVSDFVCYWFPLTHDHLPPGGRAGLVATNSIRQNESRAASLDYIVDHGTITDAVSTQPWSGDASVHVSIVNWVKGTSNAPKVLWLNDGQLRLQTDYINSSLTASVDVRHARALEVNRQPAVCFQGQTPGVTDGFVIGEEMRDWLASKDGASGAVHPYLGGREMINHIEVDRWVIDFEEADRLVAESKHPAAFQHVLTSVLPVREAAAAKEAIDIAEALAENPDAKPNRHHAGFLARWWQLGYRRGDLLEAIKRLDRYIATSRVASKNRATVFAFVDSTIRPSDSMTVFALDDDYSFGILSSATHRAWLEARCSTMKADIRYTSTTVWDSFPWPQNPEPSAVEAVAGLAAKILSIRSDYLDQGLTLGKQYELLKDPGTSTLKTAHADLDAAVMACYGFDPETDLVTQLLALNQSIAGDPSATGAATNVRRHRITDYRITAS